MGKRKSSAAARSKATPRKAPKLDTEFTCPFCNHPGAVACTIDRKGLIAEASCRVCRESYAIGAHPLTEPIDVYSEWVDACEAANEGVVVRHRRSRLSGDGDCEDAA